MESVLSLQRTDALALVQAAHQEADRHLTASGLVGPVTIAVVDRGGHLLVLERRDGASPASAQAALAKARQAALCGQPTADQEAAINGPRAALLQLASLLDGPAAAMGGGLPLLADGHCLGAVGVSGLTPQDDQAIALAAQAALAHLLPKSISPRVASPRLLAVSLSTADVDAAASFYCQRLGFKRLLDQDLVPESTCSLLGLPQAHLRRVVLQLGEERLELVQVLDPGPGQRPGRPIPADSRSCDLWFQHICIVVADLDRAMECLHAQLGPDAPQPTPISTAPQILPSWNVGAAGIRAYKFRDPEGHCLELLQFPADKGDPRWHHLAAQAAPEHPWLGLDHSAISVSDSVRTQEFYGRVLGLRLGGDGVNSGLEQDGLDGLDNTRVRITAHRCAQGAGVEALAYQAPNIGRPLPSDLLPQDLAHWQLRFALPDLESVRTSCSVFGGRVLREGALPASEAEALGGVTSSASPTGLVPALQIADPDGHRLQLVQCPS